MASHVLKRTLETLQQEHVLEFWNQLSIEEKTCLANDINNIDMSQVNLFFEQALFQHKRKAISDDKISPIPSHIIESEYDVSFDKLSFYENLGFENIANGKVAVILLAGGQGTRLGIDIPKGMYNINLPSNRTLFHIQALRIQRLQNMAEEKFKQCKGITWYIMTSEATHELTEQYFRNNEYFGLDPKNIVMFKQSLFPCFTFDGKIILDEKYKIAKAPDGNGGLYLALKNEKILYDMEARGVCSIHTFSVDNVLVKVADPIFLGYCIARSADCGVKVVRKRSADEAVGIVCQVDGSYTVVEYSEISTNTANLCDNKGVLKYNTGNICNHFFTTSFLGEIVDNFLDKIDLHVARKKIPFIDDQGIKQKPNVVNGIKIEKFIFDVFKFSKNFVVWEVCRENEFSALKNSDAEKTDCPTTTRGDILNLHRKWLLNAGAASVEGDIEICPLLSYNGENLCDIAKHKTFKGPTCLM